ncbi:MAG: MIP/aquaporin family protein [Pseudomonadota bacterium]
MTPDQRSYAAEFIGSAFLLMTIVGSGIMGQDLADGQLGAALLPHSLAIGGMLFVLITLLGPVSGAHLNPAVTLVFALGHEIRLSKACIYVAAQIAGAVLGTLVCHVMFDLPVLQTSEKLRSGVGQWVAESVATFGLLFVILGGIRTRPGAIPALVGLYIMAALWFTASTSFANPAVTLARMLTDTFSGIRPADAPMFLIAQVIGACAAIPIAAMIWGKPGR